MTDEPKRDDPTDFSQFRKPARKVDLTVVDSANESLGYSAAPKLSQAPEPAPPQRRLFKTGRNVQFNIKASAETVRRFVAISDAYEWPSGCSDNRKASSEHRRSPAVEVRPLQAWLGGRQKGRRISRTGKKVVTVYLPESVWRDLKV